MIYSINVFDRSRKTPQDIFFFSIASFNLSVISSVACAVERYFEISGTTPVWNSKVSN